VFAITSSARHASACSTGIGRALIRGGWSSPFVFILCGFYMLSPTRRRRSPVRRLQGHRPHHRPALGAAVDDAQEGLGPRQQHHFGRIKVNDLRGNPIEMAAQVVWRVTDTAQALFDVDDYKAFVRRPDRGRDPHHRLALSL
jgi:hypothetical protein